MVAGRDDIAGQRYPAVRTLPADSGAAWPPVAAPMDLGTWRHWPTRTCGAARTSTTSTAGSPVTVPGHWRSAPGLRRRRRAAALPGPLRRPTARPTASAAGWCSTASSTRATSGSTAATWATPRATSSATPSRSPTRCADRREHLLAVEVACSPAGDRTAKRNLTGVFQHWDCIDPDVEPGRDLAAGPARADRARPHSAALRVLCPEAGGRVGPTLRFRAVLDAAERRHRQDRAPPSVGTAWPTIATPSELSLAAGENQVEWLVDRRPSPKLWWPQPSATSRSRRHRRGASPTTVPVSHTARAHRSACGRWCSTTGMLPSTASASSSRAPTWARPGRCWARPPPRTSGATSTWPATPASTCCGSTPTSPRPSPLRRGRRAGHARLGRTSRCSGATPAPCASRRCARPARRSTCSATTRRSPSGAGTTSRWRSTSTTGQLADPAVRAGSA